MVRFLKLNTKAMIRNSKHLGFSERRRLVRAFIEQMPNPSLSCELKFLSKRNQAVLGLFGFISIA